MALWLLLAAPARASELLLDFIAAETAQTLGTPVTVVAKRELPAIELRGGAELALRFPRTTGQHLPSALEVRREGRLLRSIALGPYLDFQLGIVTAPQGLARGEAASPLALRLESRTLAPGQEVLTDSAMVVDLLARGQIAAGAAVKLSRFTAAPAIRRGVLVPLVLRAGGVQLSAAGEALADGFSGQALSVRRESDGRVMRGVVELEDSGPVVVVQ